MVHCFRNENVCSQTKSIALCRICRITPISVSTSFQILSVCLLQLSRLRYLPNIHHLNRNLKVLRVEYLSWAESKLRKLKITLEQKNVKKFQIHRFIKNTESPKRISECFFLIFLWPTRYLFNHASYENKEHIFGIARVGAFRICEPRFLDARESWMFEPQLFWRNFVRQCAPRYLAHTICGPMFKISKISVNSLGLRKTATSEYNVTSVIKR